MDYLNELNLNNYYSLCNFDSHYNVDSQSFYQENISEIPEFDFEAQKQEIIAWAKNKNMSYHEVNNDGGCQFYAFACAFNKILKKNNIDSPLLSELEKNQVRGNTEEIRLVILAFSENYLTGYKTDEKINQEVDQLFDTNEWGNHYSLILLSNYYNVNIKVYDFLNKDNVRTYIFNPKDKSNDEIKLLRINSSHYDYLT